MNRAAMLELLDDMYQEERRLNVEKGHEYSGDDDALFNFKACAEFLGITPLQVCLVYMYKHFAAIASYARDGRATSNESIEGRAHDLRNYVALFLGLVQEAGEGQQRGGDGDADGQTVQTD